MTMIIRPVRLTDQSCIAGLLAAMDYPDTADLLENTLPQQMSHPDALMLVAVHEQYVVGFISVHFMAQLAVKGEVCFINYLSVDPASRSMGIGALLLQHAEQQARQRGCYSIELSSNLRRSRAHAFYLKQGYMETSRYFVKEF